MDCLGLGTNRFELCGESEEKNDAVRRRSNPATAIKIVFRSKLEMLFQCLKTVYKTNTQVNSCMLSVSGHKRGLLRSRECRAVGFIGFVNSVCICVVWMGYVICTTDNSCLILLQVVFLNPINVKTYLWSLPLAGSAFSSAADAAVPNKAVDDNCLCLCHFLIWI